MQDSPTTDIRIGQVTQQWAQVQKLKNVYYPQTDSTNQKAKDDAFKPQTLDENVILYLTDLQTAGRGRGQNTWSTAAPGSQLLSTWSFLIEDTPNPTLSPQIGLAVFRAAVATWPFVEFNLKAPNDLYILDKKVGGLLIESLEQGPDTRLLIGFGFNVFAFPAEVKTATSLAHELPADTPLLAEDWISFLERLLFEFSVALQLANEPLNTTTTSALLYALNLHPLIKDKYLALDSSGTLSNATKKIHWSEL